MQKGSIRVQTENIFPIIKKFLYSEHDIFIRELVSNAVDASQKIKTLSTFIAQHCTPYTPLLCILKFLKEN
jgi:HSP90 family molecular chaperone